MNRVESSVAKRLSEIRAGSMSIRSGLILIRTFLPVRYGFVPNMSSVSLYQCRICSAYSLNSFPLGVNVTEPLALSSRMESVTFSNSAIFWLTAGWLTPSLLAAFVNEPSSATAMKVLSLKSSNMIIITYIGANIIGIAVKVKYIC